MTFAKEFAGEYPGEIAIQDDHQSFQLQRGHRQSPLHRKLSN